MRGKQGALVLGRLVGRLIPARAGKTRRSWPVIFPAAAHPRACGENVVLISAVA